MNALLFVLGCLAYLGVLVAACLVGLWAGAR